jgi:hypothetical protein
MFSFWQSQTFGKSLETLSLRIFFLIFLKAIGPGIILNFTNAVFIKDNLQKHLVS